jgi:hypothetical protein
MTEKLTDIIKGAGKGLMDLTFGMRRPWDNSNYKSLQTDEERIGYCAMAAGLVALACIGALSIATYLNSRE